MHQPYYEDLATGEHVLPWVRMHALKDYYGMVALMREFPDVQLTFNLVPSLLVQLEAFAERSRARLASRARTQAGGVAHRERARHHPVRVLSCAPRPHDRSVSALRGAAAEARPDGGYTDADFLDLQVWHKLAWVDPFYLDSDPRVGRLIRKQRNFTEEDKLELREVELEILRAGHPGISRGRGARAGRALDVAVLPSRFFRCCATPISICGRIPRPPCRARRSAIPRMPPSSSRARGSVTLRLFGHEPAGLWPSEGSVSDAVVELAANAGFQWIATDEAILGRTIDREFRRDGDGWLENPEPLYRAVFGAGRRVTNWMSLQGSLAVRSHRLRLCRLGSRRRGVRLRGSPRRSRAPVLCREPRGRGHDLDHPRRRKRVGTFRRGRPAVSARALRKAVGAPRAARR